MSLDFYLEFPAAKGYEEDFCGVVFEVNITHNLGEMADRAGIYKAMWRPSELGASQAKHITAIMLDGIKLLEENPGHFKEFNPQNGWGDYDGLVRVAKQVHRACCAFPEAHISVSV